jgi:hypothetical protein
MLIHLEPLSRVGAPIILLDSRWLPVQGPTHPFQVMGKGFDSFIAPSFRGVLSVRLVIERAIVIIVPLVMSFLFGIILFLAPIFDPTVSISITNDVTAQVAVIPVSPSHVFLRWSQTVVDDQDPDPAYRRSAQEQGPPRLLCPASPRGA